MPLPDDTAGPQPDPAAEDAQRIRQAAYERYLRRGGAPGGELEDWLEAERTVRSGAGTSADVLESSVAGEEDPGAAVVPKRR